MYATFIKTNMYFHGVKSTAHPPIIGTLGHSTNFIVKQPNMVWSLIFICIDSTMLFLSGREALGWSSSCIYKQSSTLALENQKFVLYSSFLLCIIDSVRGRFNLYFTNFQKSLASCIDTMESIKSDVNVANAQRWPNEWAPLGSTVENWI